jgi:hypothetical protein
MKIPTLVLTGMLCLGGVSFLSAKSYNFRIDTPVMAGAVQLPAGEYRLKVDGDKAVFTEVDENKSFTAPVKMETVDKKYDDTAVVTSNEGGSQHLQSIELGGSKTKLDFQ